MLTLLGIIYLDAPKRVWTLETLDSYIMDDSTLEGLMDDIFCSGNFGIKDANRYREIKYISNRKDHTVFSGGIISQGLKTLKNKVYSDFKTINKHHILLPIGCIVETSKYFGMLITGKRKNAGTKQMLKEASARKKLYCRIKLFMNS